MRFNLATVAYVFALLAAGMALLGPLGILACGFVLLFWALVATKPRHAAFLWLGIVLFVVMVLLILAPAVATSRNASLRSGCMLNIRQIMLALENYRSANGAYPPAYIADEKGRPMHSWRVLILPHIDERELYESYNFDEPWDGPNNRKLWDRMPKIYECPEMRACRQLGCPPCANRPANVASYVAVVGEGTAWPGGRGRTTAELVDPSAETLVVLEYCGGTQPWTAPVDLSMREALALFESGPVLGHLHTDQAFFTASCKSMFYLAGFGDGHAEIVWPEMHHAFVEAMLTVAGREDVTQWDNGEQSQREAQSDFGTVIRWQRVYAAIVFLLLAILPAWRLVRTTKSSEGSPASC